MGHELWFTGPRAIELRRGGEVRAPAAGEIVARGVVSGISQGTELLLFRGEGPTPFDPSLDPLPHEDTGMMGNLLIEGE